jgi:hypothetical protein
MNLRSVKISERIAMVMKLGTIRKADQKYLKSFEMWCCRRMEKLTWTDRVRNGGSHRTNEDTNV